MSYFSLGLDIVVAGLLVATIAYAAVLNKKLATLRATRQEMETLAARLVESTQQAERALSDLRQAAGQDGGKLERQVTEARNLAEDLRYLVDKGTSLADRLTTEIGKSREDTGGRAGNGSKPARPGGAAVRQPAARGAGRRAAAAAAGSGGEDKLKGYDWEDEDPPDADAQLLKALRRVR